MITKVKLGSILKLKIIFLALECAIFYFDTEVERFESGWEGGGGWGGE